MESQTQASHPSHRPWKSRSRIPTFPPLRRRGLPILKAKSKPAQIRNRGWARTNCHKWAKYSCQNHLGSPAKLPQIKNCLEFDSGM